MFLYIVKDRKTGQRVQTVFSTYDTKVKAKPWYDEKTQELYRLYLTIDRHTFLKIFNSDLSAFKKAEVWHGKTKGWINIPLSHLRMNFFLGEAQLTHVESLV